MTVPRRVSVFIDDGKVNNGQRWKNNVDMTTHKGQWWKNNVAALKKCKEMSKKREEQKESLYQLQTKVKEKKLVKGGARIFPLPAPDLRGKLDPGEES